MSGPGWDGRVSAHGVVRVRVQSKEPPHNPGRFKDLLQPGPGTRVTDVALRWGFYHLGRFGQTYQKAFGESPSQTLAALRHR